MIFREIKPSEIEGVLNIGYKEWAKGRSLDEYIHDNRKEDAYGTRFVIEDQGQIVTSMILLKLESMFGRVTYGIGSLVTPLEFRGKAYGKRLLILTLGLTNEEDIILLNSDLSPDYYESLGFKVLPDDLQLHPGATTMVKCPDQVFQKIVETGPACLPDYF